LGKKNRFEADRVGCEVGAVALNRLGIFKLVIISPVRSRHRAHRVRKEFTEQNGSRGDQRIWIYLLGEGTFG
jgi:hypothetical protein